MLNNTANHANDLAFVHWQINANEKAYTAKIITKAMYEYAKNELQKTVEYLSNLCYDGRQRQV